MHVVTKFKTVVPTREIIEKVKIAAKGGEELFEKAALRPHDEKWWTDSTNGIVEALEKTLFFQTVPDAEIIACIPESEFKGCYSERDKERVRQQHLTSARTGGSWVLYVGFLLRDAERRHDRVADVLVDGAALLADVLAVVADQAVTLASDAVLDLAGGGDLEALLHTALGLELGHFHLLLETRRNRPWQPLSPGWLIDSCQ